MRRYRPKISKAEARKLLPPGACKRCVFFVRCQGMKHYRLIQCSRCQTYKAVFKYMDHFGVPHTEPKPERLRVSVDNQAAGKEG